jgi:exonuclease III
MIMRFGTWNVRTLLQAGNMNIIVEKAERCKMDGAAFQEICWKGKTSIRKLKCTLHYSGNEGRQGNQGVGFIVSKNTSRSVLGFSPFCEGICTLLLKGKFHNITLVNAYAPTEDAEDETVFEFYETLQYARDELPSMMLS